MTDAATTASRSTAWLGASAALACLLGVPAIAHAAFIPPAGVTAYRLIFVTADTTSPTSSTIADYNAFATTEAQNNSNLPSTTWSAVGSTDGISAASNIACTPDCSGIPIFLVDGTEVASSITALFSAATTALQNGINEDQFGTVGYSGYVWTGSFSDGTQAITTLGNSIFDETLGGGSSTAEYGHAGNTSGLAFDNGSFSNTQPAPIYAISGVITTGSTPVPEPITASLLAFGGLMTSLVRKRRRQHQA